MTSRVLHNLLKCLKKAEILKLATKTCRHGHSYLVHPKCYYDEAKQEERIGFFDIETSNLKATFGYVFTYCIKELDKGIIKRSVKPREVKNGTLDKNLMKQLIKDLKSFDRVITYYGAKFDIPFVRTRCEINGLKFLKFQELKHTDLYYIPKFKFKLHSNRLGEVCRALGIPAKDHPLNPYVWNRALAGDKKALKYILTHNVEDVISTEAVWKRVQDYTGNNAGSI